MIAPTANSLDDAVSQWADAFEFRALRDALQFQPPAYRPGTFSRIRTVAKQERIVRRKLSLLKEFLKSDETEKEEVSRKIKRLAEISQRPGEKSEKVKMNIVSDITKLDHGLIKRLWYGEIQFIPPKLREKIERDVLAHERIYNCQRRAFEDDRREVDRQLDQIEAESGNHDAWPEARGAR